MRTNQDYKNAALNALRGNWSQPVLVTVIMVVISVAFSGSGNAAESLSLLGWMAGASLLASVFVLAPLEYAYANVMKAFYNENEVNLVSRFFRLFTEDYLNVVKVMFITGLKIFLWTLLLIVPGIVKALELAMTPYILQENPGLSANEANLISSKMMLGHKYDLFYLYLSFLGWIILSAFTLGIGLLWLMPYMQCTIVNFYNDLKIESQVIS